MRGLRRAGGPVPSAAFRAGALYLCISLFALTLLWAATRVIAGRVLEADAWGEAERVSFELSAAFRRNGLPGLAAAVAARSAGPGGSELLLVLADRNGRALAGHFARWPLALEGLPPGRYERPIARIPAGGGAVEAGAWAVALHDVGRNHRLAVARSLKGRDQLVRALTLAFAFVFVPTALAVAWAGHRTARALLARLDRIAVTAQRIRQGESAARIPVRERGDEFDRLGAELNLMLARNEELLAALRAATLSLAHDLRTPLTRLAAHLEEARDNLADGEALLAPPLEEVAVLRRTLDALAAIVLAESGAGEEQGEEPVAYARLLADIQELYAPVAEEQGVALEAEGLEAEAAGFVRRQLLFQALVNLVENALRYAVPPDGTPRRIALRLRAEGREAVLTVADNGPGIPEPVRRRALAGLTARTIAAGAGAGAGAGADATSVAEEAVSADAAGMHAAAPAPEEGGAPTSGLGLLLVSAVARLHGGRLDLEPPPSGTGLVASLRLPVGARARESSRES